MRVDFAMRRRACLVMVAACAVGVISSTVAAAGQVAEAPEEGGEAKALSAWPTDELVELVIERTAGRLAQRYDVSERDQVALRKSLAERWGRFLKAHRGELEPVVSELFSMRMGASPPEKSRVKQWALAARPAFELLKSEVGASVEQVRDVVPPSERDRFEVESMAMEAAVRYGEAKLTSWESGAIEVSDFWEPVADDRVALREDRSADRDRLILEAVGMLGPVDPVEAELSSWERYVRDFIRRYELDEAQQSAAMSCLKELSDRARDHRKRYRVEIAELEERIEKGPKDSAELSWIEGRLAELYGPIDLMFSELRERLDSLLTSMQRARADERRNDDSP